ncbi:hypothetical protein V5O48_010022 [Marasmius crinis-equi]|uniref:1-alkyl-2-acetylglycerophosphocholine esterase n=1 Tax=Marasmius crinis-equi TaxID=585013 RepID=A0ABR3F9N9_9AGAR
MMRSLNSLLLPAFALIPSLGRAVSLWDPTGPYEVAYTQHVFNHTTPNDPTEPGNILLLTIYYPTLQCPNETTPYLDLISASIFDNSLGFPNGSMSTLTTKLQFQAPTLLGTSPEFGNGTSPYPTIIFLPGAGLPVAAYTAYQSELASYGYTVIGIDHPGEAPFIQLPYGGEGIYGYPDWHNYPRTIEEVFAVYDFRLSDVAAVMSDPFLPDLIRSFGAPFNTTHFGILGHSIGGAAAAGAMAANDTLFRVGANLDGTMVQFVDENGELQTNTSAPDLSRPFLEIASQGHFDGNASGGPTEDTTWAYFNQAQSGWLRDLQLNGTQHLDFSDIPLWVDLLGGRDGNPGTFVGTIAGARTTQVVTSIMRKLIGYMEGKDLAEVDAFAGTVPEFLILDKSDQ